ncbi:MAG: proton-conducting transporter membrane subunit, partial [Anaerolineales bacterium]
GGLFHLFNHGLMKALAFLVAGAVGYALSQVAQDEGDIAIDDLRGVGWRYPVLGLALFISLLGLVGMPPLAGFMSKWQIMAAGVEAGTGLALALVIFAGINSVFSLSYYAPVLIKGFFNSPRQPFESAKPLPWTIQLPIALGLIAVVLIGLVPSAMNGLLDPATEVVQKAMDVAAALKGLGGMP